MAAIREAALAYESKLPGLVCNRVSRLEILPLPASPAKAAASKPASQTTDAKTADAKNAGARTADPKVPAVTRAPAPAAASEQPTSQMVDLRDDRITWFNHQEEVTVQPDKPKEPILGTSGITDFVAMLTAVFSPATHTEFKWMGQALLRGVPVLVFDYKVAKENSTQEVKAGTASIKVGYHGVLVADRRTARVMSLSFDAEVPPDFPVQGVKRLFDFGQTLIGGQFVLMPLQSEEREQGSLDLLRDGKAGGKSQQIIAETTTDFQTCHRYMGPVPRPAQ